MKVSFISCCFIFLLASCGADNKVRDQLSTSTNSSQPDTLSIDLLVFKSEGKLEIWQKNQNGTPEYIKSLPLVQNLNWPIGLFEWNLEDEKGLNLEYPSSFYRQKLAIKAVSSHKIINKTEFRNELAEKEFQYLQSLLKNAASGRFLICPNKPAKNKHFKATMNSPHWSAELYAMLELELKKYPLKYGN